MSKNSKSIKAEIITLIIVLILALVFVYIEDKLENNNQKNPSQNIENEYESEYYDIRINKDLLNIIFLNVGNADSTLITISGETMLIDAGDENDGKYIAEFIKAQNIDKIDYLIETHSDSDHSGGIQTIVRNFDIGKIYMPKSAIAKSELNSEAISIFEDLNKEYNLGNSTWKVLSVDNSEDVKEYEDNNTSIVIQLNYGDTKYLFTGDCESKIENKLIKDNKLEEVDVLKVSHHGSSSSSTAEFLSKVSPQYSVISVNNDESKHHPAESTISNLKEIKSEIYRTDIDGTIWLNSDGKDIKFDFLDINLNGRDKKAFLFDENELYVLNFLEYVVE